MSNNTISPLYKQFGPLIVYHYLSLKDDVIVGQDEIPIMNW